MSTKISKENAAYPVLMHLRITITTQHDPMAEFIVKVLYYNNM